MDGSSIIRDVSLVLIALFGLIGLIYQSRTSVRLREMDHKAAERDEAREAAADRRDRLIATEVKKVAMEAAAVKSDLVSSGRETARDMAELKRAATEQKAVAAEHTSFLKRARDLDDGKTRILLETVARLARKISESGRPEDLRAADAADQVLAEHDAQQATLGRMSTDSLRAYVERDLPESAAQRVADATVEQGRAVEDYRAVRGDEGE